MIRTQTIILNEGEIINSLDYSMADLVIMIHPNKTYTVVRSRYFDQKRPTTQHTELMQLQTQIIQELEKQITTLSEQLIKYNEIISLYKRLMEIDNTIAGKEKVISKLETVLKSINLV